MTSPVLLMRQQLSYISYLLVDSASADDGAHAEACNPRFVQRRVLALRLEIVRVENPRNIRIDHDHIGGQTRAQRSAGQTEQFRRPGRHRADERLEIHLAI